MCCSLHGHYVRSRGVRTGLSDPKEESKVRSSSSSNAVDAGSS